MEGCAGEMSFRLCEVANYLQATQRKHDVSALTHSPTRGDLNAALRRGLLLEGELDRWGLLALAER